MVVPLPLPALPRSFLRYSVWQIPLYSSPALPLKDFHSNETFLRDTKISHFSRIEYLHCNIVLDLWEILFLRQLTLQTSLTCDVSWCCLDVPCESCRSFSSARLLTETTKHTKEHN